MKISLLLAARKDSKFLAKFILTFLTKTKNFNNVELLIFTPQGEWNKDLLEYFKDKVRAFDDTTGLGRGGSHIFYEELAKHAKGDWLWYLCDDHQLLDGYDEYLTNFIKDRSLDPNKINVIVPHVDNSGWISHILSRKWYETVGFAKQGNVDSYINETHEYLQMLTTSTAFIYVAPHPVLHDYSLDKELFTPPPFDAEYEKALFKSKFIKDKIKEDAQKLREQL